MAAAGKWMKLALAEALGALKPAQYFHVSSSGTGLPRRSGSKVHNSPMHLGFPPKKARGLSSQARYAEDKAHKLAVLLSISARQRQILSMNAKGSARFSSKISPERDVESHQLGEQTCNVVLWCIGASGSTCTLRCTSLAGRELPGPPVLELSCQQLVRQRLYWICQVHHGILQKDLMISAGQKQLLSVMPSRVARRPM